MSLIQQALQAGTETIDTLEQRYAIKAKRHALYPNLVMFKYNMIDSPMGNKLVQEARGIILDEKANWGVVAFPFTKFFNEGEGHAAPIDWSTAKVQEKLDGSLMIMYHYDGQWHIASSGTPDACGQVNGLPITFADLFWETWSAERYELPEHYENFTFMFELMTPYNRVVVPHKDASIALIGVRHRGTEDEKDVQAFIGLDWQTVKEFPLNSLEAVCNSFEHFDGIDQEGYVVVDGSFNRVKIKHPGYVAIHHLKGDDGPSLKKMLSIVRSGESSEVLTYFPEWKPIYDETNAKYVKAFNQISSEFHQATLDTSNYFNAFIAGGGVSISPAILQKEFASHAVKSACPDALFKLRAGKVKDVGEYLSGIPLDRCMDILSKI